jgi:translation elongation factor EF-1alpha
MVDKRTLEKFERESKEMGRESWFYSWALDTGSEVDKLSLKLTKDAIHFWMHLGIKITFQA